MTPRGGHDDAVGRWRHKGVEAIPYSNDSAHADLWHTLEAWAERAHDPDAWQSKVIKLAKKGPAEIQPHERGQVTHIVSTYEGMKKFCVGDNPPPAEWLCVFDANRRFARPGYSGSLGKSGPYVDSSDLYGLDSDAPPSKVDPEDHYAKREPPPDAWDAFRLNRLDRTALRDDNVSSLRGRWASVSTRLVPRIGQLGMWIAQVCHQPATVWWASHQSTVHKDVREYIRWELERSKRSIQPQIRQAWRFLFEAWERPESDFNSGWYERWANEKQKTAHERWKDLLPEFLRIWPRQISAKSPNTSARLCELAFSRAEQFPLLADLVLPLLTKIERDHLRLPNLQRSENNIVDRYPAQTLALLYTVLPDNALAWPYGIEASLQRIGEADKALNVDERLITLRRRWDAR